SCALGSDEQSVTARREPIRIRSNPPTGVRLPGTGGSLQARAHHPRASAGQDAAIPPHRRTDGHIGPHQPGAVGAFCRKDAEHVTTPAGVQYGPDVSENTKSRHRHPQTEPSSCDEAPAPYHGRGRCTGTRLPSGYTVSLLGNIVKPLGPGLSTAVENRFSRICGDGAACAAAICQALLFHAAQSTRWRSRSKPALPYIWRLIVLSRFTSPSTGP